MHGVLIIDKPSGPTSFDVVEGVRRALGVRKAGHTGTLDPMATGVLPVCLGEATKLVPFLTEEDKVYEAEATLGEDRDTQDKTGIVVAVGDFRPVREADVQSLLPRFIGRIDQVPPMHSAVKVGGERLYALARRGQTVERAPRSVVVHALELLLFDPPRFALRVRCSKGTYVRTLAHDLGHALGCGAHLSALRRLQSGRFGLDRAVSPDELASWAREGRRDAIASHLVPLAEALAGMPAVRLDAALEARARRGERLAAADVLASGASSLADGGRLRLLGADGSLVAVAERRGERVRVLRGFARPAP